MKKALAMILLLASCAEPDDAPMSDDQKRRAAEIAIEMSKPASATPSPQAVPEYINSASRAGQQGQARAGNSELIAETSRSLEERRRHQELLDAINSKKIP